MESWLSIQGRADSDAPLEEPDPEPAPARDDGQKEASTPDEGKRGEGAGAGEGSSKFGRRHLRGLLVGHNPVARYSAWGGRYGSRSPIFQCGVGFSHALLERHVTSVQGHTHGLRGERPECYSHEGPAR